MKKMLTDMLSTQTSEIKKYVDERISQTDATIAPIVKIYKSTEGFSSVLKFVFNSLIIPLSVFFGIVLAAKKLFFGVHGSIK